MSNPRDIFVVVARELLGERETSKNRSPVIDKFWKYTSYPDGGINREPWCSACISYVVQEADKRSEDILFPNPPKFAACRDWPDWAQANGGILFKPHDGLYFPQAGDIVLFRFNGSAYPNHIGLVTGFTGANVTTIEGNTNVAGSREGDGVYEKVRDLNICFMFIRCPAKARKA